MDSSFERSALALILAGAITMVSPPPARAVVILGPDVTPANQSQTVIEGTGPQTLEYSIGNPNAVAKTFAGVRQFQLTFLDGENSDPTDVPINFRIGGGSCFVNFANGPGATIPAGKSCALDFTYTTAIDEPENNDSGSSRLKFVTAFQEDVSGTQTNAFGFITVVDPAVPEPPTWLLMLLGFAGLSFAASRHVRRQAS